MLFHVDMIYLAKHAEKKLCFETRTVTKSNLERFSSVLCQNKESMQMFCQFSSEQEHFTHGMYMTALIRSSGVKSNRSCSMKE